MKKRLIARHPVAELASLLLFGIFVLFLLLMLLFSARIYQQTVKNTNAENTLGTAVSYLTTKFRQHDTVNGIFTGKLDNLSALCFRDTLNDQDYITYIYLDQGNLKELFLQTVLLPMHLPEQRLLNFLTFRSLKADLVFILLN